MRAKSPMPPNPLQDPRFLPFKLDLAGGRVLLVRLDAQARADAAFLDERALPPAPEGYWMPIDAWRSAPAADTASRLDWIFHIGHCGSTLLSRLLQAWPEVAPLREPLPLRALAAAHDRDVVPHTCTLLRRLAQDWARPLPPASRTVIKATSSCNALAAEAMRLQHDSRALWLDMALEPWLATILKSPHSIADVIAATPERLRLLASGDEGMARELHGLAPHRQCAMGWLAERARRAWLPDDVRSRCLPVDFDALLAGPEAVLFGIAQHLGLARGGIAAALASPWWRRYSKAGEHAYAATDRAADLRLARARHGDAIGDAQAWLDGFAARHPRIAAVA